MNSMKGASGNMFGSSILGSLFGRLFGAGQGGGEGGGGLFGGMFGSGSSGASSSLAFEAGGAPTGVAGIVGMIPSTMSAGAGTAGAAGSRARTNTVLGGLMSKVFTHGIGSGKFGLSGSAVGMLGAMIGLESITGAYSAGSPIGGLLGGAAGGALTGFAIGGPLGAAIGGIIGGIAGLFGGIFGKRKKKHQAWDLVLQKYVPAIQQVVDDYANFQMQFQDAMSQLDQLQNQAKQDLHGLGGTGDKISPKAFPGVSTMRAKGSRAGRTIARGAAPSTSACRCSMRGVTWATARTCWPCCATVRL